MPHSVSVDTSHENGHLERAIARERAQKETEERAWKYGMILHKDSEFWNILLSLSESIDSLNVNENSEGCDLGLADSE